MILSQPDFSVQPSGAHCEADSRFLVYTKGKVLLTKQHDAFALPTYSQLQPQSESLEPFEMAHTDASVLFSPHPFKECSIAQGGNLQYEDVGIFRSLPGDLAAEIVTGLHLWNWYQNHRYCGRCAKPMTPDKCERALRCSGCGQMVFPTIAPAVIVAITCGDRILLAQNAHRPVPHYALIAGYVEVGETLEHAVHREVFEEVGIKLKSLAFIGDQPWGVTGSHMFAFHATADDTQPIRLQESELSDARWFDRKELTPRDNTISVAFELIERFRNGIL